MSNSTGQKFKVGDMVSDDDYGYGTILHFDEQDRLYVVDFDVSHPALSDCNGHAHSGNGLYIDAVHLTLIESAEERLERLRKEMQSTPLTFIPNDPEPSRAMIAAMAMQGLIQGITWMDANDIICTRPQDVAEIATVYADALIAELQKPKP
jgi:hypothetical protein